MRDLKFRVWNKTYEKYEDFNLYAIDEDGDLLRLEGIGECVDLSLADEDDDYIIEQYTGVNDKNGKAIYEGDILDVNGERAEVVFEKGIFCVILDGARWVVEDRYEIVGNIHEEDAE